MTMGYIEGFDWPVPLAFAAAVSACRFEQGDLLYSDAGAYECWSADWLEAGRAPAYAIQVLAPARSGRAALSEDSGKRFFGNWDTQVEIELTSANGRPAEVRSTTQGRVFCCLWRGDPSLLDESARLPEPPMLLRDLHGRLEQALPAIGAALGADALRRYGLYVWGVDQASESSRAKAHAVEAVLAERFDLARCDLAPADAGIEEAGRLHPALRIRALLAPGDSAAEIERILKALLYTPVEGKADRFSLSRHGLLKSGEAEC